MLEAVNTELVFHHQPEAPHPKSSAIHKPRADYPIYAEKRLAGLDETGDRGAEPKYTAETNKRILTLLDQVPPKGYARWTGPLLAAALGDVDVQYIWRFLRAQKIDLAGRKS